MTLRTKFLSDGHYYTNVVFMTTFTILSSPNKQPCPWTALSEILDSKRRVCGMNSCSSPALEIASTHCTHPAMSATPTPLARLDSQLREQVIQLFPYNTVDPMIMCMLGRFRSALYNLVMTMSCHVWAIHVHGVCTQTTTYGKEHRAI